MAGGNILVNAVDDQVAPQRPEIRSRPRSGKPLRPGVGNLSKSVGGHGSERARRPDKVR